MGVLGYLLFFYFIYRLFLRFRFRTRTGQIKINDQTMYYTIGDGINILGITTGSGIDVRLPKKVPHLYLDSHKDSKTKGTAYYIDPSQKISLEGNFDEYFQLFASKGNEPEALSFITPDLMQVLIDNSEEYDIELYNNHIKLLCRDRVFGDIENEQKMIDVIQKILPEILHKLNSWDDKKLEGVENLLISNQKSIKFKGKYTGVGSILVLAVKLLIGFLFIYGVKMTFWPETASSRSDGIVLCATMIFIYYLISYAFVKDMRLKLFRPK